MENINMFQVVSVGLSVIQFVGTMVVFMVIKFNDLKHTEEKLSDLAKDLKQIDDKNSTRHEENLKAFSLLTATVQELKGRCDALHSIKN